MPDDAHPGHGKLIKHELNQQNNNNNSKSKSEITVAVTLQ